MRESVDSEVDETVAETSAPSPSEPKVRGGRSRNDTRSQRGRPPVHGLYTAKRQLACLTTKRLDGRSAVAVAVRNWKADIRADLGGSLSRAQETLLEVAAQTWVLVSSIDDWLSRQPSIVTKKRALLPVVTQRQQLADSLARLLERLGLSRVEQEANVAAELAALHRG